jgi:hypothetical protein
MPSGREIRVQSCQNKHVLEHQEDPIDQTSRDTLTIAVDNFTGHISSSGCDSKYGRWSYFQTRGQNGRSVMVVTIYQVCNQPVASTGSSTACKQQHTILDEDGRITTNA